MKIHATKIWDLESSSQADGGLPTETDLRGEIHPTGLLRYKGWWYCGLKESPLRRMRLVRSRDGEEWESVRLFTWRDATVFEGKFSVTPDGAFMINTYVRHRDQSASRNADASGRWTASVNWLSHDGVNWCLHACPTGFNERNFVRWSVTWFRGAGYSIARPKGDLYKTLDGKNWALHQPDIYASWQAPAVSGELAQAHDPLDIRQRRGEAPQQPHEAELAFDPADGTACAIARTHPVFAILGTAAAPDYGEWQWRAPLVDWDGDGELLPARDKLGVQMGGPALKYLSNGVLLAAGRADASTPGRPRGRLTLFVVDRHRAVLKRWGDFDGWSHYPGIAEHEGELWITCGKQQKADPFAVYLLRVPVPEPKDSQD